MSCLSGVPRFAHRPGPEIGFANLTVFFRTCNFNCLYCQNWHFREDSVRFRPVAVDDLVADVDERTACICYFGGDPSEPGYSLQPAGLPPPNSIFSKRGKASL